MSRPLLLALLLCASCTSQRRARLPLEGALDDVVLSHVKPREPGYSVLVASHGRVLFRRAHGLAEVPAGVALTPEHAFQIGSITKQFTAAAILLLEREGKLSTADELTKWVDFPTGGKHVTLAQLLSSTSGIPDFTLSGDWKRNLGAAQSAAQFLARFAAPPTFEPGSEWYYSNTGYYLLGVIIERASGLPRARFLRERFFAPLGMRHTRGLEEPPAPGELLATGYQQDQTQVEPAPFVHGSQVGAAGDLVSTVDDLLLWSEALEAGRVLLPTELARARTVVRTAKPGPFDWTWGWAHFQAEGHDCFGAKGSIDSGFTTFLADCPDAALVIAVLANSTDPRGAPERVALELAHEVFRTRPRGAAP